VTQPIDEFHLHVARIALAVAQRHGFALGGGLALIVHGILMRPTEDVDLFSDLDGTVVTAARIVCDALIAAGIEAVIEHEESDLNEMIEGLDDHMVELTAYRNPSDEEGVRLSLGTLYRAHRPVVLEIGPVLHLDDLCAWKVAALVARAEPRDLVDVGAFLESRSIAQVVALARQVDPGIEDEGIAAVGRRLDSMPDRAFAAFGYTTADTERLRGRFRDWPRG
jgi:hypothetical protein